MSVNCNQSSGAVSPRVEVAALAYLPVPYCPYGLCGRKATLHDERQIAEVRSCVNVEVAVLAYLPVPNCPYGLCGRKATLHDERQIAEVRSCVNVEVAVLASPSLIVLKSLSRQQRKRHPTYHFH